MGSYENIVKIEEIRRRFDEGDLLSAQKVLDTMELKKLKNLTDLNLIAEVYAENERYEEAAAIYHKIYDKVRTRKSLFQLIEILIRLSSTSEAERYLEQYHKIAPRDFYNYIFRYKIDKMKGESYEHLIEILETLKKEEYTEKWAYELAKLYYKAGMEKECIRECSDIELWFGEGTYVEKAKILKAYYSGEANKDKIMEEIKRRAEVINHKEESSYIDQPRLQNDQELDGTTEDGVASVLKQEINDLLLDEPTLSSTEADEECNTYLNEGNDKSWLREPHFSGQEEGNYASWTGEQAFLGQKEGNYESWTGEQAFSGQEEGNYASWTGEQAFSGQEEGNYASWTGEQAFPGQEEGNYASWMEEQDVPGQEEGNYASWMEEQAFSGQDEGNDASYMEEQDVPQEVYEQTEDDIKLQQLVLEYQINIYDIFGNFLHVPMIKQQLVKLLEDILQKGSDWSMLLIAGAKGSGKTTLAKDIALFYFQNKILKSSKLAKIKAGKLNNINLMSKRETLKDCCMVIENASELKGKTFDQLIELMQVMQGELAVIFEEETSKMDLISEGTKKLTELVTNRIYIP